MRLNDGNEITEQNGDKLTPRKTQNKRIQSLVCALCTTTEPRKKVFLRNIKRRKMETATNKRNGKN